MTSRQLAAMETRKKLLEAGKELICRKGLGNTSVEEITEAAGVAKGTFYTYFQRKEEIVYELSRGMFGEILENARKSPGGFCEKLADYMIHFSGYIEKGGARLAQDWVKSVVAPAPRGTVSDRGKLRADLEAVEELFRYGIAGGMLREDTPSGRLSRMLVDLLYGQMLCWSMSDGSYSLQERTREFCGESLRQLLQNYIRQEAER